MALVYEVFEPVQVMVLAVVVVVVWVVLALVSLAFQPEAEKVSTAHVHRHTLPYCNPLACSPQHDILLPTFVQACLVNNCSHH